MRSVFATQQMCLTYPYWPLPRGKKAHWTCLCFSVCSWLSHFFSWFKTFLICRLNNHRNLCRISDSNSWQSDKVFIWFHHLSGFHKARNNLTAYVAVPVSPRISNKFHSLLAGCLLFSYVRPASSPLYRLALTFRWSDAIPKISCLAIISAFRPFWIPFLHFASLHFESQAEWGRSVVWKLKVDCCRYCEHLPLNGNAFRQEVTGSDSRVSPWTNDWSLFLSLW